MAGCFFVKGTSSEERVGFQFVFSAFVFVFCFCFCFVFAFFYFLPSSSLFFFYFLTCSAMHAHFGGLGHRGDGVRDHSS